MFRFDFEHSYKFGHCGEMAPLCARHFAESALKTDMVATEPHKGKDQSKITQETST